MAAIRKAHGDTIETNVHMGSGGVFDVAIDGEKVYRKFDTGRFPGNEEILAMIAAKK